MCVVSMVSDHYMQRFPQPTQMSPQIYEDIMELIRKAKEYDRMTGQPDCPTDTKRKWISDMEARRIQQDRNADLYRWYPNKFSYRTYTAK